MIRVVKQVEVRTIHRLVAPLRQPGSRAGAVGVAIAPGCHLAQGDQLGRQACGGRDFVDLVGLALKSLQPALEMRPCG